MGHVCTRDQLPPDDEHPVVAVLAIVAIIAAIVLITWVRLEVHGTGDLEAALSEETPLLPDLKPDEEREVEAAVTSTRFATGFSP